MDNKPIAVIGAGNGGTAIAAHILEMEGSVNICDLFPEFIKDIKSSGYINLDYEGKRTQVKPNIVTSNIGDAIKNVEVIMVVTPAFTHKMIAEACYNFLEDGQIIILNPGRTGGALEFLNTIRELGCEKEVVVAETETLIYSCRKTDGNSVSIYGIKKEVNISSIPSNKIEKVINKLKPFYPQFKAVKNTAWTSFSNIGSMFHPIPVLFNIGRIENNINFKYYWEGITPSIAKMIEVVDLERCNVANAYGANVLSAKEWLQKSYNTQGANLHERILNNSAYEDIFSPTNLNVRYITEDVPTGLVPISELARIVDVRTPNIDAIIKLASSIYEIDFRKTGRTLESLGLNKMNKSQVLKYFERGIYLEEDYIEA